MGQENMPSLLVDFLKRLRPVTKDCSKESTKVLEKDQVASLKKVSPPDLVKRLAVVTVGERLRSPGVQSRLQIGILSHRPLIIGVLIGL